MDKEKKGSLPALSFGFGAPSFGFGAPWPGLEHEAEAVADDDDGEDLAEEEDEQPSDMEVAKELWGKPSGGEDGAKPNSNNLWRIGEICSKAVVFAVARGGEL